MLNWLKKKLCSHDWEEQRRPIMLPAREKLTGSNIYADESWVPSTTVQKERRKFRKCLKCGRLEKRTGKASPKGYKTIWVFFKYEDPKMDYPIRYEELQDFWKNKN